jgi:hypothetical protein
VAVVKILSNIFPTFPVLSSSPFYPISNKLFEFYLLISLFIFHQSVLKSNPPSNEEVSMGGFEFY